MKTGLRRHRVLLQRAVETQDGATGEMLRSWADVGYWHCEIAPLSARETVFDGGIRDDMDSRLRGQYSRHVIAMKSRDRAVADIDGLQTVYNFVGIARIASDKSFVEFRAKSGMNDG